MNILLTGGTGYIASNLAVQLIEQGHTPVLLDNLVNSHVAPLVKIEKLTGVRPEFVMKDIRDTMLEYVLDQHKIEAVIHLAGLKSVKDSVAYPDEYYKNNIEGTLNLLWAMRMHGIKKLVFSSSACVYANLEYALNEDSPLAPSNPYGWTKLMIEQILRDYAVADPKLQITILRYFNPIGGIIPEHPKGTPNNLMPILRRVAEGKQKALMVYGNDYPTPDGTAQRDYIHVADLADGHIAALNHLKPGVETFNLGSGVPVSVLDLVYIFERANQAKVPIEYAPRRPGDIACTYADASKAERELGWKTVRTLMSACI